MAQPEAENDTNPVSTLCVIGAGTMGHGIAQTAILAGVETILIDIDSAALDRALESIGNGLERLVSRDRISDADRNAALARLATTFCFDLRAIDLRNSLSISPSSPMSRS